MDKSKLYTHDGFEVNVETTNLKHFREQIFMGSGVYTDQEIRKLKNNLDAAISMLSGLQQFSLRGESLGGAAFREHCRARLELNELAKSIVYALGAEVILKDK